MSRRFLRQSFALAGPGDRFGGLIPTLGAGSTIQLLAAVAGFVTIPIIVRALGSSGFGVLVVVVSLAPWLTLIDGALYPATRLLVGESRGEGTYSAPVELLRSAFRIALKIAAMNAATLVFGLTVLPLVALFGAQGVATRGELVLAVLGFSLPVIASGPGGIYLGALEGVGRTVVAAIFTGVGPLFALPATLLVVAADGGLVELCSVQGLSVALPRLCAWAYWYRRPSLGNGEGERRHVPRLRVKLVLQLVALSAAVLVQSGLDPVIVSSQLGADDAGSFGLASRLVIGSLIPLGVVVPLFAGRMAAARAAGWPAGSDSELRRLLLQATLAGTFVAGCVVLLGPWLAEILGGGVIAAPRNLYVAGGAYVLVLYAATPLYLAFMGPRSLKRSLSLTLVLMLGNVGMSVVLARAIGPAGPLWATAGATLVALVHWMVVWRRHPEWLAEAHGREQSDDGPASSSAAHM